MGVLCCHAGLVQFIPDSGTQAGKPVSQLTGLSNRELADGRYAEITIRNKVKDAVQKLLGNKVVKITRNFK